MKGNLYQQYNLQTKLFVLSCRCNERISGSEDSGKEEDMVAINRLDYLYSEYSEAQLWEQELRLCVVCSLKDKSKRKCCIE